MHDGSIILPSYQSGTYFNTHEDPDQDSPFKAAAFEQLWNKIIARKPLRVTSYADVGCGGGATTVLIADGLARQGSELEHIAGYDISPHVLTLRRQNVNFHFADFCCADETYDLVTLFDVIEHVPDPITFLRSVADRCNFIGLHIPLDHSLVNCFFDRFSKRIQYPGHLVVLDAPMALNLIAMSGLWTLDYSYTFGYAAPSGTMTWMQRLAYPVRATMAKISPWLASRTVGGVSLMLVAATPRGVAQLSANPAISTAA